MKRLTFIGLLLGLTILSYGQTIKDKQEVIQICIDLEELQNYYHETKIAGKKTLIIFNDGIVPNNLNLTKFGQPVRFMTSEDLFFKNIKEEYLDFDKFEITQTTADLLFHYKIERLTIKVTLEKLDGEWIIKTNNLIEK